MALAQRIERLEARVTTDQKELFKEAAEARGQSLTDFIVSSVRDAALAALHEKQVFEISRRDQQAFVDALLSPAQANDRLRAAAERHGYLLER
jgi:uncharacterized protein (DUF1778 family)